MTSDNLLEGAVQIGGTRVVVAEVPESDANVMRQLIDQLRKRTQPIAVLLGSTAEDKVTLVAGITRDLEERGINAGNWIRSCGRSAWAAAAAASPTWPRPAASTPKSCRKPWKPPAAKWKSY